MVPLFIFTFNGRIFSIIPQSLMDELLNWPLSIFLGHRRLLCKIIWRGTKRFLSLTEVTRDGDENKATNCLLTRQRQEVMENRRRLYRASLLSSSLIFRCVVSNFLMDMWSGKWWRRWRETFWLPLFSAIRFSITHTCFLPLTMSFSFFNHTHVLGAFLV